MGVCWPDSRDLRVIDTRTDDFRQPTQEISAGGGKLVAANEELAVVKSLFNTIVIVGQRMSCRSYRRVRSGLLGLGEVIRQVY